MTVHLNLNIRDKVKLKKETVISLQVKQLTTDMRQLWPGVCSLWRQESCSLRR